MEKVFDQDGWQLWFSKDAAERAFIGEFGPFFGYSKFSSPVGDYQGPYESLPAFRHFFYPETCMNVSGSTVKRNLQLLMMQYPGGGWTTCSIYADTDLLGEIQLGVEIPKKPLIIPLGLRTNDFCLKFVFSSGTKTPYERQPVAARVFLLQITH